MLSHSNIIGVAGPGNCVSSFSRFIFASNFGSGVGLLSRYFSEVFVAAGRTKVKGNVVARGRLLALRRYVLDRVGGLKKSVSGICCDGNVSSASGAEGPGAKVTRGVGESFPSVSFCSPMEDCWLGFHG